MTADFPADPTTKHRPGKSVDALAVFEILVRENADFLTAFLTAATDDLALADDIFQETMLVAWRRIGDFDRSRPFGAWLRGIAKRLLLAHAGAAPRERSLSTERVLDHLDARVGAIERRPGDTLDEKVLALRECVEELAPHYREPIRRHYHESVTTERLAADLAITKEAVQKRLQRARILLAECLGRKGVFGGAA